MEKVARAQPRAVPELERELEEAHQKAGRLEADLEEKTAIVGVVNSVLRAAAAGEGLPEVLRNLATNLRGVFPFDSLSLSLLDPERKRFHTPYVVAAGVVAEAKEETDAPRPDFLRHVVETRNGLILSRERNSTRAKADRADRGTTAVRKRANPAWLRRGFGCEMVLPLHLASDVIGTLNLGAFQSNGIQDGHMRRLAETLPALALAVHHYLARQRYIFL